MTKRRWLKVFVLFCILSFFSGTVLFTGLLISFHGICDENTDEHVAVVRRVEMVTPTKGESGGILVVSVKGVKEDESDVALVAYLSSIRKDVDVSDSLYPGQTVFYRTHDLWIGPGIPGDTVQILTLRTDDEELISYDSHFRYFRQRLVPTLLVNLMGTIVFLFVYRHIRYMDKKASLSTPSTGAVNEADIRFQSSFVYTADLNKEFYRTILHHQLVLFMTVMVPILVLWYCLYACQKTGTVSFGDLLSALFQLFVLLVVLICLQRRKAARAFRRALAAVGGYSFDLVSSVTENDVETRYGDTVDTSAFKAGIPIKTAVSLEGITGVYISKNQMALLSDRQSFVFDKNSFTKGTPDELMAFLKGRGLKIYRG